jgi:hypothetical protein
MIALNSLCELSVSWSRDANHTGTPVVGYTNYGNRILGVRSSCAARSVFQRRQPFADGVLGQLRDVVNVELLHDVASMRVNGIG